jgi:hypothetical protein
MSAITFAILVPSLALGPALFLRAITGRLNGLEWATLVMALAGCGYAISKIMGAA